MCNAFFAAHLTFMTCFIWACDWISSVFIIYVGKQMQALINVLKCRMAYLYSFVYRMHYLMGGNRAKRARRVPLRVPKRIYGRLNGCVSDLTDSLKMADRLLLCNIGPSLRSSTTLWRSHSLQWTVTSAMSSVPCFCPPASTRRSITLMQNHFDMLSLRVNRQILSTLEVSPTYLSLCL